MSAMWSIPLYSLINFFLVIHYFVPINAVNMRTTRTKIKTLSSLATEDSTFKNSWRELETYALLKRDSKSSLSDNFTICAMMFSSNNVEHFPLTLLGADDDLLIKTYIDNSEAGLVNTSKVGLSIQNKKYHSNSNTLPMVYPGEWVKSCLALSMKLGSIKWVLDGLLVIDTTSESLSAVVDNLPVDLSRKILIGATKERNGWKTIELKVADFNIFSTVLTGELMKEKTKSSICDEIDGDYLSWKDMEWEANGKIDVEIVDRPCQKEPKMTLFPSQFVKMSDCMHHCQKLGGRAPTLVTKERWEDLQNFMRLNFFEKEDHTLQALDGLWLSLSDEEKEGEWRDFYTGPGWL